MYVRNVWFRGTNSRDSPVCAPHELHMICLLFQRSHLSPVCAPPQCHVPSLLFQRRTDSFVHDQLYTAVSRVRCRGDIRALFGEENVVYRHLLL